MKRLVRVLACTTAAFGLTIGCHGQTATGVSPEDVLSRASAASRSLGSVRGEMHITVTPPGQETIERTIEYGAGPEGVFIDAGFQLIVAANGRILATQVNVEDKYVSAPFDGDFATALAAIGGERLQIPDLPPIALHQARDEESWINAFRFRILGPLTLASETVTTTEAEQSAYELRMTADNGFVLARFDSKSGLLISMDLEGTPPGAPASMLIRASVRFTTQAVDDLNDFLKIDIGTRIAVKDLEALTAETIGVGAKVPQLVLESIRGDRVDFGDLRGSVVVLDFWASWCAPCWGVLEQLEDVVAWAEDSDLPVVVWAVNTSEIFENLADQRASASRLWKERGFQMDSLIDPGSELFASIGAAGLPMTVIIAPDGTVAVVHLGVLSDMRATIRAEVEELLESNARGKTSAVTEDSSPAGKRIAAAETVVAAEAQRLLDAGAASVSVALLVGHKVVSATAYGHANVFAQSYARPETIYNVGSTFKPVTATAVLQLVDDGRLRLDDPVETYLPEFPFRDSDGHPVTVRHLLNHTSELTVDMQIVDLWSREAPDSLSEIAARLTVHGRPGERFEYNNAAFAVAGLLVERVSGMTFEEYLLSKILLPLGISINPVRPTPAMVERLALPYEPDENGRAAPVAQMRIDVFPAGDIYMTASDMARLLSIHVNGGRYGDTILLTPEAVDQMQQPGITDYGLGWGILPDGDRFLIGHGGGVPGYAAFVLGDPEEHIGVAAMSTSGDLSRLANAALAVLRGESWVPPEERQTVEVPLEILAEYVGKYELQPGVVIEVYLNDGELYALDPGGRRFDLQPQSESTFFLLDVEATLTFVRDDNGKVISLNLDPGGDARRIN